MQGRWVGACSPDPGSLTVEAHPRTRTTGTMNDLILAHGGINGGAPLVVLLPFVVLGVGTIALRLWDRPRRAPRREAEQMRSLPTVQEQPLRDVHASLVSHRKALKALKEPEDSEGAVRRKRRPRTTRMRRVV